MWYNRVLITILTLLSLPVLNQLTAQKRINATVIVATKLIKKAPTSVQCNGVQSILTYFYKISNTCIYLQLYYRSQIYCVKQEAIYSTAYNQYRYNVARYTKIVLSNVNKYIANNYETVILISSIQSQRIFFFFNQKVSHSITINLRKSTSMTYVKITKIK